MVPLLRPDGVGGRSVPRAVADDLVVLERVDGPPVHLEPGPVVLHGRIGDEERAPAAAFVADAAPGRRAAGSLEAEDRAVLDVHSRGRQDADARGPGAGPVDR